MGDLNGKHVKVRSAQTADLAAVHDLLRTLKLPTAGVASWLAEFLVAESAGAIVGVAGVERYRDSVLLRSVAVQPTWRSSGLGRTLVESVLQRAASQGSRGAYLLTTTAEHYFPRLGFTIIPRSAVPAPVQDSVEFREACPASAIVMHRVLTA